MVPEQKKHGKNGQIRSERATPNAGLDEIRLSLHRLLSLAPGGAPTRRTLADPRPLSNPDPKEAADLSNDPGDQSLADWLEGRRLLNAGVVVRMASGDVAAIVRVMVGHRVSYDGAADSTDDESHRAADDRAANRASNGASDCAVFIRHGGCGKRERRHNGGRC
jgi:hypothetical protein